MVFPPEVLAFLPDSSQVFGEDPSEFKRLLRRMAEAIRPTDLIEWIWARDLVHFLLDARRLRRLRDESKEHAETPSTWRHVERFSTGR